MADLYQDLPERFSGKPHTLKNKTLLGTSLHVT